MMLKLGGVKVRVDSIKIEELKSTANERALNEGYVYAIKGIKIEDLKIFEFKNENGTAEYIIADNFNNAVGFYILAVGEDKIENYEISEIKRWNDLHIGDGEDINALRLKYISECYPNGYTNPSYINFHDILRDKYKKFLIDG